MNVVDIHKFEEKLREAERRLGITDGIPVTYERGGDTAGKLLISIVIVAILVSLLARSKSIRQPLNMDSFVSIMSFLDVPHYSSSLTVTIKQVMSYFLKMYES